jgi:hypothetical protein
MMTGIHKHFLATTMSTTTFPEPDNQQPNPDLEDIDVVSTDTGIIGE